LLLERDTVEADDIRRCFNPEPLPYLAASEIQPPSIATV